MKKTKVKAIASGAHMHKLGKPGLGKSGSLIATPVKNILAAGRKG